MPKIYIENNDGATAAMFREEGWTHVLTPEEADLICFMGGSDVSPELYGESNTSSHTDKSADLNSVCLYTKARILGVGCVGICKGGQLLHVLNGGVMAQHIEGHNGGMHSVLMEDGSSFNAPSSHHQGMLHTVYSADRAVDTGYAEDLCLEVVVYNTYHAMSSHIDICFQSHPEWDEAHSNSQHNFFNLIYKHTGLKT